MAGHRITRQSSQDIQQETDLLVPKMQDILGCLDVHLEEELVRYRRHKSKLAQVHQTGVQKENRLAALEIVGFKPNRFRQSATSRVFNPSPPSVNELNGLPTPTSTPTEFPDRPPITTPDVYAGSVAIDSTLITQASLSDDRVWADMAAFAAPPEPRDFKAETIDFELKESDIFPPDAPDTYAVTDTYQLAPVAWDGVKPSQPMSMVPPFDHQKTIDPGHDRDTPLEPVEPDSPPTFTIASPPTIAPVPLAWSAPPPLESDLELPPELSEAELLRLSEGSVSIAIDRQEQPSAIDGWANAFVDEETPWPDHLDEEPSPHLISDEEDWTEPIVLESSTAECPVEISDADLEEMNLDLPDDRRVVGTPPLALPPAPLPTPAQLGNFPTFPVGMASTGITRLVAVGTHAPQSLKPLGIVPSSVTDGYLASSEALLDNLEEEEGGNTWIANLNTLFTPLGVGSALLLLFSALVVSVVLINPELVSHWGLNSLWSKPAENSEERSDPEIPAPPIDSAELSAQEFLDLDLGNLRTVTPQNGTVQPGSALNVPRPGQSTLPGQQPSSETGLLSNLRDSVNSASETYGETNDGESGEDNLGETPFSNDVPAPTASYFDSSTDAEADSAGSELTEVAPDRPLSPVSRPAPTIFEPEVAIESSPAASGGYSVVTPYTSDQLLDQAQTIVPDAYLKNTEEGANIQFGVFSDPDSAAALVEQLQEQGISVQVVPTE